MAANTNIAIDAFALYLLEDIDHCDSDDVAGGLKVGEIYYCYLPDIISYRIPSAISTNEYAGTVTQKIICKENKGFKKIKCLVDTSELTSKFSGSKDTSELDGFLLGTRGQLVGLSRKFRNRPFVFIVKDNNGRMFLIGTLASPAYMISLDLSTGLKYEDDNGAAFKMRSNAIFYEYKNEIPVIAPEELPGDFDKDFDLDFD